jgi:hypothetical protein
LLRQKLGGGGDADGETGFAAARAAAIESAPPFSMRLEHRPVASPPAPAAAVTRLAGLYLGQGAASREARLEFRGGALGGTTLHLVSGAGGVEVRAGAPTDSARQALAQVIDRVGLRLRSRGIVVRAGRDLDSGARDGGRGGDARRGK